MRNDFSSHSAGAVQALGSIRSLKDMLIWSQIQEKLIQIVPITFQKTPNHQILGIQHLAIKSSKTRSASSPKGMLEIPPYSIQVLVIL